MGVVNSVANRSMSTFTLSERCGRGACAPAESGAELDGAGPGATAWGAGAEIFPREDW